VNDPITLAGSALRYRTALQAVLPVLEFYFVEATMFWRLWAARRRFN
jgi:hypothetical protein